MAQSRRLIVDPTQVQGNHLALTAEQHHYLCDILRLRSGDRFIALDGQGQAWQAVLKAGTAVESSRSPYTATLLAPLTLPSEPLSPITLMTALPKGNAFDEVVRQATELGVMRIVPVLSDRTLLRPSVQKLERWRRIALEATEQSERAIAPTILDPCPFPVAVEQWQAESPRPMAAMCVARREAIHLLNWLPGMTKSPLAAGVWVAVGPEGGWTEAEVAQAIAAGFDPVSLGGPILRAVTAAIAAVCLVSAAYQAQQPDIPDIHRPTD
ncbi:16S rRNA (uracil(1498)-N(3))-methyltransferase [Trichothermofontia sichuanensis B231]|uniref:16S rRNA (uracil(1498)-N(3))-methyltransferase n=1 Tax=Trichothermofontia sichuanensis TaxID=3045816 RepID=UPI00224509A3|nr:16S rRNA (uracil(1498)-N(3))-methyltransferase [Trichothermofontia sichuanensis]UZQ54733.1 16S rRNA (uracil(1498)-N(3))-methyltransferase [Trichothermofontia sichuanensis B231]